MDLTARPMMDIAVTMIMVLIAYKLLVICAAPVI